MVDLATLDRRDLVALAQNMPACFPTTTNLAERLIKGRNETGKRSGACRSSRIRQADRLAFADVKNTGGRHGGSITAAQFLQRFVRRHALAHLDIAGTAMGAPKTEINHSWGSGYACACWSGWLRNITKPKIAGKIAQAHDRSSVYSPADMTLENRAAAALEKSLERGWRSSCSRHGGARRRADAQFVDLS